MAVTTQAEIRETGHQAVDVLVVGAESWSVGAACTQLQAAGHTVHRCSDEVDAPFPCNALVPGRGCPLDRGSVRVVLAVRGRPGSGVAASELGAVCGLRAHLPLVLAGFHGGSPLEALAPTVPNSAHLADFVAGAVA